MTPTRTLTMLASVVALAAFVACGSAPKATLADSTPESVSATDQLVELRDALRALESHPRSRAVDEELDQAKHWLDRARSMTETRRVDTRRLDLVLDAARGQLVLVQTTLARLDAGIGDDAGGLR